MVRIIIVISSNCGSPATTRFTSSKTRDSTVSPLSPAASPSRADSFSSMQSLLVRVVRLRHAVRIQQQAVSPARYARVCSSSFSKEIVSSWAMPVKLFCRQRVKIPYDPLSPGRIHGAEIIDVHQRVVAEMRPHLRHGGARPLLRRVIPPSPRRGRLLERHD